MATLETMQAMAGREAVEALIAELRPPLRQATAALLDARTSKAPLEDVARARAALALIEACLAAAQGEK